MTIRKRISAFKVKYCYEKKGYVDKLVFEDLLVVTTSFAEVEVTVRFFVKNNRRGKLYEINSIRRINMLTMLGDSLIEEFKNDS